VTVEQQKDAERFARYIEREQLVSVMNATKWRKLQNAMANLKPAQPRYLIKCLRDAKPSWERDWRYHLPSSKCIEWVDIDPVYRERWGALLPDLEHDGISQITSLLREHSIPYQGRGNYIRVYGYRRTAG
jgi:hypothetical protein